MHPSSSTASHPRLVPSTLSVAAGDLPATLVSQGPPSELEATRLARLVELLGTVQEDIRPFPEAIRAVVFRHYERFVVPLVRRHWPASLDVTTDDGRVGRKLKFLACNLYASAPYTVLFCSERRPWMVRWATRVGSLLSLSPSSLASLGALAMGLVGRAFAREEQRRIVLIAAFIATIDHVFDHCLEGVPPLERERRMKGLLAGTWLPAPDAPSAGPFRLTRALQEEMAKGLSLDVTNEDRRVFDAALARVVEWIESEVKGMTGVPDPRGLCWRTAGVEGTIDGLIFPVHRFAGENARRWMYGVSMFVQILDDWIDYEQDKRDIRLTPVITGAWTEETVRASWTETVEGIRALARSSGLTSDAYLEFVTESYRSMIHEVMEAMVKGIAA